MAFLVNCRSNGTSKMSRQTQPNLLLPRDRILLCSVGIRRYARYSINWRRWPIDRVSTTQVDGLAVFARGFRTRQKMPLRMDCIASTLCKTRILLFYVVQIALLFATYEFLLLTQEVSLQANRYFAS
jgi:hypothetical protein